VNGLLLTSLSEANQLLMKLRLLRIKRVRGDEAFESEQILFCLDMLVNYVPEMEACSYFSSNATQNPDSDAQ